jgi:nitroreductase/NAD-dependent dihydropyrimidine dehydrogenase PreA subunit
MPPFDVDAKTCTRDGLCVAECPARIIRLLPSDAVPVPEPDFASFCIGCGHCVAVCPTGAFRLDWLAPEQCPEMRGEGRLTAEAAEQFLRGRRSIRTYREAPVERAALERLLAVACHAPSAKNGQPWHWTVVESPAETRRLAGLAVDWMRGYLADKPKVAGLLGFTRVVAAWDAGVERVLRGAPHVIVAHADKNYAYGPEDTALALGYLELYAPALGLGTCWAGYFYAAVNAHPPLFEALKLPAKHKAFGAVMAGYPAYRYQRLPVRRPPAVNWINTP